MNLYAIILTAAVFSTAIACKASVEHGSLKDITSDVPGTPARTVLRTIEPNNRTKSVLTGFGSNPNCFQLVSQPGRAAFVEYYLDGFSVPECNSDTNASILSPETLARRFAHIKVMQQKSIGSSNFSPYCFWNTQQDLANREEPNAYAIRSANQDNTRSRPTVCVNDTEGFMIFPHFQIDFTRVDIHINSSGTIDRFQLMP